MRDVARRSLVSTEGSRHSVVTLAFRGVRNDCIPGGSLLEPLAGPSSSPLKTVDLLMGEGLARIFNGLAGRAIRLAVCLAVKSLDFVLPIGLRCLGLKFVSFNDSSFCFLGDLDGYFFLRSSGVFEVSDRLRGIGSYFR